MYLPPFCCLATLRLLRVHTNCSLLTRGGGLLRLIARRVLKPHHPLVLLPDQVGGVLRKTSVHLFRDICGNKLLLSNNCDCELGSTSRINQLHTSLLLCVWVSVMLHNLSSHRWVFYGPHPQWDSSQEGRVSMNSCLILLSMLSAHLCVLKITYSKNTFWADLCAEHIVLKPWAVLCLFHWVDTSAPSRKKVFIACEEMSLKF